MVDEYKNRQAIIKKLCHVIECLAIFCEHFHEPDPSREKLDEAHFYLEKAEDYIKIWGLDKVFKEGGQISLKEDENVVLFIPAEKCKPYISIEHSTKKRKYYGTHPDDCKHCLKKLLRLCDGLEEQSWMWEDEFGATPFCPSFEDRRLFEIESYIGDSEGLHIHLKHRENYEEISQMILDENKKGRIKRGFIR